MLEPKELAQYLLTYDTMTPKKLQKLAYYSQAWYYTLYGEALTSGVFEAWVHGPVCPDIYHEYKHHGWNKIPRLSVEIAPDIKPFLDVVYNTFSEYTGDELEEMTHEEDPWKNARVGLKPYEISNNEISLEEMKKYYSKLGEDNQIE